MSKTDVKRVQTELPPKEYETFYKVLKQEGLTVKEAAKQALEEWTAERIRFDPKDPLFDFSKTIEIGKGSSRKIDRVVYSREAVD
jgi:hypothetical protein